MANRSWSGRAGKGAMKDVRKSKRVEATARHEQERIHDEDRAALHREAVKMWNKGFTEEELAAIDREADEALLRLIDEAGPGI